jgi:stage III sporulation protein SpoIIIAA
MNTFIKHIEESNNLQEISIKMIEGLHLTATNKKHIAHMIANDMKDASNASFDYTITSIENDIVKLTMTKRELDDRGRKVSRRGNYVIKFKR